MKKQLISYARVSTQSQADKGYGLDAQHDIIKDYADRAGYEIVCQVSEVESGGALLCYRHKLREALDLAKKKGYELACLRPDRLARDVSVGEAILSSNISIHVVDLGGLIDDPMLIRMCWVLAARELTLISKRIKEGIERARREGKKLGDIKRLEPHRQAGSDAMKARFAARRETVWPIIQALKNQGYNSNRIAEMLNNNNTPGLSGGRWTCRSVQNVAKHYKKPRFIVKSL